MSARFTAALAVGVAILVPGYRDAAVAQPPMLDELAALPDAEPAEPVVGQLEHSGWMLSGPRGRHYMFGGLAVADYALGGRRHMVTLQQQEPTLLPQPDDKFLYYRELGSGRRWAIGRYPLENDTYVVYVRAQPAAADNEAEPQGRWELFHRARLLWPERQTAADGAPLAASVANHCAEGN